MLDHLHANIKFHDDIEKEMEDLQFSDKEKSLFRAIGDYERSTKEISNILSKVANREELDFDHLEVSISFVKHSSKHLKEAIKGIYQ